MIELTAEQIEAVDASETVAVSVLNPRTGQEFVLLPRDRYEAMQKWVAPLKRRWDDPADDDLIENLLES